MIIKAKFDRASIHKYFQEVREDTEDLIGRELLRIGTSFVDDARTNKEYQNRTWQLVSSIGCIVLKQGVRIAEYWPGEVPEGVQAGQEFASSLSIEYPTGYALIVVAGKHYAGWVEAKGYDVLTMSGIRAAEELRITFGVDIKII